MSRILVFMRLRLSLNRSYMRPVFVGPLISHLCSMQYSFQQDTIAAIATGGQAGAIAIIRVSGPEAFDVAEEIFSPARKGLILRDASTHTLHFGAVMDGGTMVDEVLVSIFKGPKSFTGEDSVEISCHGSTYIQESILHLLIRAGARPAKPGEFTQRAFLNGRMDLSQAEAVADLIASESEASHRLAMHQMKGGFSREIRDLRQKLIDFASLVELELDFAEEDVEFANRGQLKGLVNDIRAKVDSLARSFRLGNVIKSGVQTVIAGRPNAGKSTLLNALLEEDRAIVSDIPGTTRDTIEETLNIHGVLFRLIDTAGIREATDTIEAIGVEKTLREISRGTILVYLYDVAALSPEEVEKDLSALVHDQLHVLVVANKRDKVEALDDIAQAEIEKNIPSGHLYISGKDKIDTEILKNRLYELVIGAPIDAQQLMVTNLRHYEALQRTREYLDKVLLNLDEQISGDLLAMDIRQALYHLGEITGEVTADDLLGNIFSRFCIGK